MRRHGRGPTPPPVPTRIRRPDGSPFALTRSVITVGGPKTVKSDGPPPRTPAPTPKVAGGPPPPPAPAPVVAPVGDSGRPAPLGEGLPGTLP